ncbi:hypothetical protein [Bdellovibrio bacteriovorus]|uniref:hypothetical protein n=1 Tax=Bdellovibrio bacteriovorus TaxID=959 RepID=UPI0035A65636
MKRPGNGGFMIIQALMAAMLLGILGLAFAGLVKDMWLESQTLQSKSNELSLVQALRQQVSTPSLCNASFDVGNRNFNPASSSRNISVRLNSSNAGSAVTQGATLQNWSLTVLSMRLENIAVAISSFAGETLYVGDMALQVQATSGRKNTYKEKTLGKLFLKVSDATNTIIGCFASEYGSGVASSACASLGGTYNQATSVCDMSSLKQRLLASVGQCPEGETTTGFDSQGKMLCGVPVSAPSNYQCRGSARLGCTDFSASMYNNYPLTANCCPSGKVGCEKIGGAHKSGSCGPHGDRSEVYQDYICTCKGVQ